MADLHRLVEDLLELSRVEAGVAGMQIEPVDPAQLARSLLERMGKSMVPVEVDEGVPAHLPGRSAPADADVAEPDRQRRPLRRGRDPDPHHRRGRQRPDGGGGQRPGRRRARRNVHLRAVRPRGDRRERGHSGAGLGLALVTEHAMLHGGSVRLEDREGGGSRFVVELPVEGPS